MPGERYEARGLGINKKLSEIRLPRATSHEPSARVPLTHCASSADMELGRNAPL